MLRLILDKWCRKGSNEQGKEQGGRVKGNEADWGDAFTKTIERKEGRQLNARLLLLSPPHSLILR